MNYLYKFFKMPSSEKALFIQAVYYLLVFRIKLVHTPPKILFAKVAKASSLVMKRPPPPVISAGRIAGIIDQASRFLPYTTCLSKALAASVLFAQNSYMADLHIGVLINKRRQLQAHAWLSHDGNIVLGNLPDLALYQELPLELNGDGT